MKKLIFLILILILSILFIYYSKENFYTNNKANNISNQPNIMINLKNIEDVNEFKNNNDISVNIKYEYNDDYLEKEVIYQSIKEGENINDYKELEVIISKGTLNITQLKKDKINELGKVPIMMYHGIVDISSNETKYTGGNVDKDGYTRTAEAFKDDLEFYYKNNYRMIRLKDYINGNIDTEYGKSPIILTFDDGNENNIKVTGLDEEGNIIIDPNSAVGILESFKEKYPDYNVTATFFINDTLFNQEEYDEKIINWLVNNGYDIGNHTKGHIDIKKSSIETVNNSIGYVYNQLDNIIPEKYVNIIALPFGSPYTKENENFKYVINSTYNNKTYTTQAALRVGWEPEVSPYHKDFDPTFLKRCRAYDNNNKEFDISMVFENLESTRYISDGSKDTIIIPCSMEENLNTTTNKTINCY